MNAITRALDVRSTDGQRQMNGAVYPAIVDDGTGYRLMVDGAVLFSYGYADHTLDVGEDASRRDLAREKCEAFRSGFVVAQLQSLGAG